MVVTNTISRVSLRLGELRVLTITVGKKVGVDVTEVHKWRIFSDIIKGQTKSTFGMCQVEDHVRPDLTRRVPTWCVAFFVAYFHR